MRPPTNMMPDARPSDTPERTSSRCAWQNLFHAWPDNLAEQTARDHTRFASTDGTHISSRLTTDYRAP
jgi:hypothetical protein